MATWITAADVEKHLGHAVYVALYDEDNDGPADAATVAQDIALATALAESKVLIAYNGALPSQPETLNLIRTAVLLQTKAFAYDRHREVQRQDGSGFAKQAEAILDSVVAGSRLAEANGPIAGAAVSAAPIGGGFATLGGYDPDDCE